MKKPPRKFDEKRRSPGGPTRPPRQDRLQRDFYTVEGIAAVCEFARHRPSAIRGVFSLKAAHREAEERLRPFNLSPQIIEERDPVLVERPRWSPVWAEVNLSALSFTDLTTRIASRSKDLIIALDHVSDPRNLGAIVRTAAFFGLREVIVPERRQVLLTDSSVNTSQGGFALTDLVVVVNLGRALEELKDLGYWIVGADMAGEAAAGLRGFYDKMILVLGSEEDGLSPGVRAKCDRIIGIAGRPGSLESLNVSVAGGILMNALVSPESPPST